MSAFDDITCSFSTNQKSVRAAGRIRDILFVHMASMKVFIDCAWVFPCVWHVQSKDYKRPKDERNRLRLQHSRNKSEMSSSMSVVGTLQHQTTVAVCSLCDERSSDTILCERYSTSIFSDTRVSVLDSIQDTRRPLCQCCTVNRGLQVVLFMLKDIMKIRKEVCRNAICCSCILWCKRDSGEWDCQSNGFNI